MRTKLLLPVIAACAVAAVACSDATGGGTGKLSVQLTDAPFPFSEVSRVDVFIVRIDAKTAETTPTEAASESNMSGWTTVAEPNAAINLLDLAGGSTMNLGEQTLPTGTYRGFRLIIDPAQSSITLNDGTKPNVQWPSAARTGIKVVLDAPISLTEGGSVMVVDFDVGRSFVMRGNSIAQNGLLFKPVVRGTALDITGRASGTVRGDDATGPVVVGATVEVLEAGTPLDDTDDANIVATTTTDDNGVFEFGFLLPGTYVVRATPPTGSVYQPALLVGGLTVTSGEEASGLLIVLGR
ncbi:MAG: DUF4382 domain-containing protein [Gemmatimonadaceae bacterium]